MNFSKSTATLLSLATLCSLPLLSTAEVNKAERIAPDVYFHEGDLQGHGHCNNGWIVFEDYVLVVDGNFPSGAEEIIPKIKAVSDKPIRFDASSALYYSRGESLAAVWGVPGVIHGALVLMGKVN